MHIFTSIRTFTLVAVVALATLVSTPAEAARSRSSATTITVSRGTIFTGDQVAIQGAVTGPSAGARVQLQRLSGRRWLRVSDGRVTPVGTYAFFTSPSKGTSYRVRSVGNRRIKRSVSAKVTVAVQPRPINPAPAPAPAPPPAPAPAPAPAPTTDTNAVRNLILQRTNDFRRQHGRAPLTLVPALTNVAQAWSSTMAATTNFNHNPSYWLQYPAGWSRAGENIAAGQTPEQVVDAWIASPSHRDNLLGDFNQIGIGYAVTGGGARYYTQDFAKY